MAGLFTFLNVSGPFINGDPMGDMEFGMPVGATKEAAFLMRSGKAKG